MRLWHKDLIDVLPNAQLRGQWNEINAMIGSITKFGSPKHGLVNYVMTYDSSHFMKYIEIVLEEIKKRNVNKTLNYHPRASLDKMNTFFDNHKWIGDNPNILFENHHDNEYLIICYYNLLEKFKSGLISQDEWAQIKNRYINKNKDLK